jgi:GNAT superfamily N-acetyltransferase
MTIREAVPEDIAQLSSLFDGYRVFYHKDSDVQAAGDFLSQRIRNKDAVLFVAEDASKQLAGFVQLYPLFSSTRMKRLWLLNDLFVAPAFRGTGISIALIEKAKTLCIESGSCGMLLETAKSNVPGNQLYPKTGFSLDTDHNYYTWEIS